MKTLKIFAIATLLVMASAESANGRTKVGYLWYFWAQQQGIWYQYHAVINVETSSNMPSWNALAGGHARITLGDFYRIQPFVQFGKYIPRRGNHTINIESYRQRGILGPWEKRENIVYEFYFPRRLCVYIGFDIRITDENFIRTTGITSTAGHGFSYGYVRKQNFSNRIGLDLNIEFMHIFGRRYYWTRNSIYHMRWEDGIIHNRTDRIWHSSKGIFGLRVGVKLRFEIFQNFKLEAGVSYLNNIRYHYLSRRDHFSFETEIGRALNSLSHPFPYLSIPQNIIEASIGVHYKIPVRLQTQRGRERAQRN